MLQQFRLETFCCCFNLKTGSLIIGTLGWLFTSLQIFCLTYPLKQVDRRINNSLHDTIGQISYSIITLIVCVLMIFGVYKNNKRYILPWLVLKCLECIAWTVLTFVVFIFFFFVQGILQMLFLFFVIFFVSTLNWYFWICVWCLYKDLAEEGEHKQNIQLNELDPNDIKSYPVEIV